MKGITMMAFPFEQIGMVLRKLSLHSGIGNGLALVLWIGMSLMPLWPAVKSWKEKEKRPECVLLILMSGMLLTVLYCMINPGVLYELVPGEIGAMEEMLPVMKAVLGMAVWSVAVCYVVFRLLRLFKNGTKEQLFGYLRGLLYMLCILFAGAIALSCVPELITGLQTIQRSADGVMAVVRFIVAALPYVMDVVVTILALMLIDELLLDNRSERVVPTAQRLSKFCCLTLALVTASGVGLNILQLLLAGMLSNVNVNVTISIMSLAFVLAALLFARLIEENKQLADDNEMFI